MRRGLKLFQFVSLSIVADVGKRIVTSLIAICSVTILSHVSMTTSDKLNLFHVCLSTVHADV